MLGKDFANISLEDNSLTIGASTPTGRVISFARKNNISGFEFFSKLPGSVGGMLAMNAGVKSYEIFNILDSININGEWITKDKIAHGYRFANLNGVALEVKFNIDYGFNQKLLDNLVQLRANQPKEPSAGSAFKNPQGDYAGRLIEEVGLKGYRVGDMEFSKIHSNFLVNHKNGTFKDAKYLLDLAKDKVYNKFKIVLEEEVKIL
jgi:UDP-N-acetylmuramate dehydrogenase